MECFEFSVITEIYDISGIQTIAALPHDDAPVSKNLQKTAKKQHLSGIKPASGRSDHLFVRKNTMPHTFIRKLPDETRAQQAW